MGVGRYVKLGLGFDTACLAAAFVTFVLALSARRKVPLLAEVSLITAVLTAYVGITMLDGGLRSAAMFSLAGLPVVTVMAVRRSVATILTIGLLLLIASAWALGRAGVLPPSRTDLQSLQNLQLLGQSAMVFLVYTVALRFVDERSEAQARYRSLLAGVPDVVLRVDASEQVLDCHQGENSRLFEHLDDVLDRPLSAVLPAPLLQASHRLIQGARRGESGLRERVSLDQRQAFDVSTNMTADGVCTLLMRDVSAENIAENTKREFVSTVSHELRTPLTSIRGALGLMDGGATGALPESAQGLVRVALGNTRRLQTLINDLLDMEKMASGRMAFHFERLDVMALIEDAVLSNQGYAEMHRTTFIVRGRVPDVQIKGDPDRLLQVMANFLSNAAKFSPSEQPVYVDVTALERNTDWIRIAVSDSGPGIPDAFRSRIFERFSQADSSDTRQKGGTGLGLAISKAIVEHHHGYIGFDSVVGAGSTFWMELPRMVEGGQVSTDPETSEV